MESKGSRCDPCSKDTALTMERGESGGRARLRRTWYKPREKGYRLRRNGRFQPLLVPFGWGKRTNRPRFAPSGAPWRGLVGKICRVEAENGKKPGKGREGDGSSCCVCVVVVVGVCAGLAGLYACARVGRSWWGRGWGCAWSAVRVPLGCLGDGGGPVGGVGACCGCVVGGVLRMLSGWRPLPVRLGGWAKNFAESIDFALVHR